jgi:hypothetical protein
VETRSQPSPEVLREPNQKIEWACLLSEAMTVPGSLGNTYNFYRYSFLNTILLQLQGVQELVVVTAEKFTERQPGKRSF